MTSREEQLTGSAVEAAFKTYELTGMVLASLSSAKRRTPRSQNRYDHISVSISIDDTNLIDYFFRSCSVSGKEMLFGKEKAVHDLGSDLSKLALEIPFSHQEETAEEAESNEK